MMYSVRGITRADCTNLILNVHYAKRWPSISFAFGLFLGDEMVGCVTFGTPPSPPLRTGIAGKDLAPSVIELNRLVLARNIKNEASMLVSSAIKMIGGNHIIVSFADTAQGHRGVVYQACGFSYHGLSAKRTDWKLRGLDHLHGMTVADEFRGQNNRASLMREKYGADFYLQARSRKHRYIRVIGSKGFRVKASRAILYPQEPYPK